MLGAISHEYFTKISEVDLNHYGSKEFINKHVVPRAEFLVDDNYPVRILNLRELGKPCYLHDYKDETMKMTYQRYANFLRKTSAVFSDKPCPEVIICVSHGQI